MFKPVRKAVIPAAGLGTRFLPATKATPKEMLPIVDKPTIQYIIEEALVHLRQALLRGRADVPRRPPVTGRPVRPHGAATQYFPPASSPPYRKKHGGLYAQRHCLRHCRHAGRHQ